MPYRSLFEIVVLFSIVTVELFPILIPSWPLFEIVLLAIVAVELFTAIPDPPLFIIVLLVMLRLAATLVS